MRICLFIFFLSLAFNLHAQKTDFADFDFHKADSIATLYKGSDLSNLPILAYQLTSPLESKAEQFRAIHSWVCTNISLDYWYFRKNKIKRQKLKNDSLALVEWNSYLLMKVFTKLLNENSTVCTGYAYLVKELSNLAGIKCEIIDGYGRSVNSNIGILEPPNHSWNAVELNNKWYLCDATWSAGFIEISNNKTTYIKNYNDAYFLADPALFILDHYPIDTAWILLDQKPTLDAFIMAPLIYKEAYNHIIIPTIPMEMKLNARTNDSLIFTFSTKGIIQQDSISLILKSGTRTIVAIPIIISNGNEKLEFMYQFKKRGYYDVLMMIGEDKIVSYTCIVTK